MNKKKNSILCEITWISYQDGGRKCPFPAGEDGYYYPLIKFKDQNQVEAWSAAILVEKTNNLHSIAELSFAVDNAPFELLKPNKNFQLYEGFRLVATGITQ